MTTHVFIVNENTFPAHLEYMFAGTSSGERDWNISLLADIKRVRTGDKVIFYFEGIGFYGIFKIKDNQDTKGKHIIYWDKDNYCNGRLGRKLLYRVLIEPDKVYPKPVGEWDALEKLPDSPRDIVWSLIYRKLKGFRGCTPITPRESNKLSTLLREANGGNCLKNEGGFTWQDGVIIETPNKALKYDASRAKIVSIEQILYQHRKAETYLQAYFTENAGVKKFDNTGFAQICGKSDEIVWLGNEIFCGVGMQKIDIFTITNGSSNKMLRIIELKTKIDLGICKQLERYVNWCLDYLSSEGNGASPGNLYPMVVLPKPSKRTEEADVRELIEGLLPRFNENFKNKCQPVTYFEYDFDENKQIIFAKRALR